MSLERRYRKLLRAYPLGYRAQREEEILGTYLELAGQDRRWPTARDATDVLASSLRERLRANGTLGVIPACGWRPPWPCPSWPASRPGGC